MLVDIITAADMSSSAQRTLPIPLLKDACKLYDSLKHIWTFSSDWLMEIFRIIFLRQCGRHQSSGTGYVVWSLTVTVWLSLVTLFWSPFGLLLTSLLAITSVLKYHRRRSTISTRTFQGIDHLGQSRTTIVILPPRETDERGAVIDEYSKNNDGRQLSVSNHMKLVKINGQQVTMATTTAKMATTAFKMSDGELAAKPVTVRSSDFHLRSTHNYTQSARLHFRLCCFDGENEPQRRKGQVDDAKWSSTEWLLWLPSFDGTSYWSQAANNSKPNGLLDESQDGTLLAENWEEWVQGAEEASCGNNVKCLSRNQTLLMAVVVTSKHLQAVATHEEAVEVEDNDNDGGVVSCQPFVLTKIIKIISILRPESATVAVVIIVIVISAGIAVEVATLTMHCLSSNSFVILATISHPNRTRLRARMRLKSSIKESMTMMIFTSRHQSDLSVRPSLARPAAFPCITTTSGLQL